MEASERTPLLAPNPDESEDALALKHELLYKRFSPTQKRLYVAIVAWSGQMACVYRISLVLFVHWSNNANDLSHHSGLIRAINTSNRKGLSFFGGGHQVSLLPLK